MVISFYIRLCHVVSCHFRCPVKSVYVMLCQVISDKVRINQVSSVQYRLGQARSG
jgi:hypothetical protein